MVRRLNRALLAGLVLVGCAAPREPRVAEPEPEHYAPAPVTYAAPPSQDPAPLPARAPCPQCAEKRADLDGVTRELEATSVRREEYAKTHCKGTITYTTRVFQGGSRVSGGPERAWLCDGKLVQVLETPEEQVLATRAGDIRSWIKKNCENDSVPAFGEKRCVWP